MPLDCFRFSPPHSRAILAIVHRRTTSHAAVDPFKPFCGVADREESRQRAGVLRFLPLAQRRTGNLSNSFFTHSGEARRISARTAFAARIAVDVCAYANRANPKRRAL